ncbi:hypothetical protein ABZ611_23295 [Streptomyces sp. NPDC007861]|uniref:hypothetical protein n=1 Tax=Streptomyces sp. NPDC007861 TaxID=3154893 RepID=UPI0033FF3438
MQAARGVAQLIPELFDATPGALDRRTRTALDTATRTSLRTLWHGYTSMLEDFARPVGAQRQIARAAVLSAGIAALTEEAGDAPGVVEAVIRAAGEEIGKEYGHSDFRADRLNRADAPRPGSGRSPNGSTTSGSGLVVLHSRADPAPETP